MRAKIFFITLAVDDLERSVVFYRDGLGWPTEGIVGQHFHDEVTGADETIAFFTLDGGLLLGLYERTNLAKDANLPPGVPSSTEFSLGVPAASQTEVDEMPASSMSSRSPRRSTASGAGSLGSRVQLPVSSHRQPC